jgi:hypothetical protein
MTDQTMRLGMDPKEYIAGADKAEKATKKVGKAAASIGDEFGKAMIKIDLLKMGLLKVNQIMEQVNALNVGASKTRDDRAQAVGAAVGSLGMKNPYAVASIIENRKGAGSKDANADVSFLTSLVGVSKGRPAPLSDDESMQALSFYNRGGDMAAGAGGSDFLSLLSQGHTTKSAAAILGKTRGGGSFYDEAGKATFRSNEDSARDLEGERNRSAAGDEARMFSNFAAKRAEQGTMNQIYEYLTPDPLEKVINDSYLKFRNYNRAFTGLEEYKSDYKAAGDPATEATIKLFNAINNLSGVTGSVRTIPNGKTEAP